MCFINDTSDFRRNLLLWYDERQFVNGEWRTDQTARTQGSTTCRLQGGVNTKGKKRKGKKKKKKELKIREGYVMKKKERRGGKTMKGTDVERKGRVEKEESRKENYGEGKGRGRKGRKGDGREGEGKRE